MTTVYHQSKVCMSCLDSSLDVAIKQEATKIFCIATLMKLHTDEAMSLQWHNVHHKFHEDQSACSN